ncbi:transcription elongation factor spt4 [Colletotrichum fioriniae]|uniref:transcription elongation factor spt4 n=1 Tax=Colletotrichum fioriniae TaxID=710243 RepID=UPI0032DAB8D9|nr:transcription elongation factor spt4 [Colletotrichum fioriniae]
MSADNFVAPGQQRYLRACMVCSIVMTYSRFRDEGCPNCEDFLHMAGSQDQIESCTSQVFEGLITLSNPKRSWVAKWQRLDNYVRGRLRDQGLRSAARRDSQHARGGV